MPGRPQRPEASTKHAARKSHGLVDPIWLLKAFSVSVLIAVACAYLTLCALFYHGQWQLVLHPARTSAPPLSVAGIPFQPTRFGAGATGVPQLTGWWIPTAPGSAFTHLTILFLPGADGSLADDQSTLASLHDAGLTVFAIDYRGFGQSADLRPSQASTSEDSETAWRYLTETRGIATDRIIPYGKGIGAYLALKLASGQPSVPAMILDQPDFGLMARVESDSRSKLVPVRLLFHDRFALLPLLDESQTPKLILSRGSREDPAVLHAADPKLTVFLPGTIRAAGYTTAIKRFLDQYGPPARLVLPPTGTPAVP